MRRTSILALQALAVLALACRGSSSSAVADSEATVGDTPHPGGDSDLGGDASWPRPPFDPPGTDGPPDGPDDPGGSTGSSTGGASTGGTDTGGFSGGSFVNNDSASSCGTMCDPWTAGDCPEGEKCTSVACEVGSTSWDSNVCRPIGGDRAPGEACMSPESDGNDDCEDRALCLDPHTEPGLGIPTCYGFCDGSPTMPSCDPGFECAIYNNGVLPLCLPACDPESEDCSGFSDWPCAPDGTCDCSCFAGFDPDCAPEECAGPGTPGDDPDTLEVPPEPQTPRLACPDSEDPITVWMSNDDSNSQASPILARRAITDGGVPDPARIRIHEFLNYYDLTSPQAQDAEMSVTVQMRRIDAQTDEHVLLMQARSRTIVDAERPPFNLVFSLDTSGSMSGEPIALLKDSIRAVAGSLREGDVVSLVEWNANQQVVLEGLAVSGPDDATLLAAIDALDSGGSTDLHGGLVRAYELANDNRIDGGINRVILVSDGGANTGVTDTDLIASEAEGSDGDAIYLVGVGVGRASGYRDDLMDTVTDAGKGAYLFVDETEEAERMFGPRFLSNVAVAARDVRFQVTLPWYFGIKSFHGEGYSPDPAEVEPQHLAPNDAMNFHQTIQGCAPGLLDPDDSIDVTVEYEDPLTGEVRSVSESVSLPDVLAGPADLLQKADVVVSFAKGLIVVGNLHQGGQTVAAQATASAMAMWLADRATDLEDDEVAEMAQLMQSLAGNL